ncbi:MAG TPA: sialate O-acetylesterase, partial [Pyrinomonadaceae bacterium]|nr:sialate O-acetylesterase [Pyrinomonadaceae bacterium]
MPGHTTKLLLPLLILLFAVAARADVRLPAIISDNMVLQQGMKVRIWGNANPKERITVAFDQKTVTTAADSKGLWDVWIGPLNAGGPSELIVKGDNNILTIKNVLVGEVWICSGQSNMEWTLNNTLNATETLAQANYPEIRSFRVEHRTSTSPLTDVEGQWVATTPAEAAHFSAVGYFFGREIYQRLKVPVGLINTSWGGTPAEAWTSHDALKSSPELKPILEKYESSLKALPQTKEASARALAQWEAKNLYLDAGNKGEA